MRALLGLGDNTTDLYVDQGVMYPGGNTVNVAVLAARLGRPSSYLGVLGNDGRGQLILNALRREGVNISRVRTVPGTTSWSRVRHHGTDRVFDGDDIGVSRQWTFTPDDDRFIGTHHTVHTSVYSGLDDHLPRIRAAARLLSYDYSTAWTPHHLSATAPLLDVAFLSGAARSPEDCVTAARHLNALGTGVVVVTRGAEGALAVRGPDVCHQPAAPAQVSDTLGAGDAFIAAFLHHWTDTPDLPGALLRGAQEAARNCVTPGAFGHGAPYTP